MDSKADERDDAERALLARYHARPPAQPPAALDVAIRAAARKAVVTGSERDHGQSPTSAGGNASPSPWMALAAAVAMAALVLPGLLREPDAGVVALKAESTSESAVASSRPAPLALGGALLADQEAQSTAQPAPQQAAERPRRARASDAREQSGQETVPALAQALSDAAIADRDDDDLVAYALNGLGESDAALGDAPDQMTLWVAPVPSLEDRSSSGLAPDVSQVVTELVTQHRLEGRFRPEAVTSDQLNVTLLESLVLIQGDWAADGASCDPSFTLDRRPGEPALVSVERIAASQAEDFVFLRLESPSRVRLVHCTAQGWVITAR
ncbi:MAG: hypothetical protein AAGA68_00265 [Pseudomonadota bacterium]